MRTWAGAEGSSVPAPSAGKPKRKSKPGLGPIPVPHLSLPFSSLSLALPDSVSLGARLPSPGGRGLAAPTCVGVICSQPAEELGRVAPSWWPRQRSGTMAGKKVCIVGSGNW